MKRTVITLMALLPAVAMAEKPWMEGFTDNIIVSPQQPEVRQKLDRQGATGGPGVSELSVQLYVDSQARMAETFQQSVPDDMTRQTRSGK